MRLAILGAEGMLGRAVLNACAQQNIACWPYSHGERKNNDLDTLFGFDIADANSYPLLDDCNAVINCVGVTSHKKPGLAAEMVRANALGPHVLSQIFRGPIIHVSTDCVFSGIYDGKSVV